MNDRERSTLIRVEMHASATRDAWLGACNALRIAESVARSAHDVATLGARMSSDDSGVPNDMSAAQSLARLGEGASAVALAIHDALEKARAELHVAETLLRETRDKSRGGM